MEAPYAFALVKTIPFQAETQANGRGMQVESFC